MPRVTKKERRQQIIDIIVKNTLMAVGLEISNTFILDQDSGLPWKVNNKFVRYHSNKVISIHKDQILFEPLESKIQVRDLMNISIAKGARYDNLYVKSIFPEMTAESKRLVILTDKDRIKTEEYAHEILIYYDMMFRINEMLTPELLNILKEADTSILPPNLNRRKRVTQASSIKKGPFSDVCVQS